MIRGIGLVLAFLCLLVSPSILLEHGAIGVHNYVSLVADVHDYYKTSCVMLIQPGNYNEPSAAGLMHSWFLEFSRRGIFSMVSTIPRLVNETEEYYNKIPRPLFVVLLDTKESMDEFALVTVNLRISFPIWLVLFMQHLGNPLQEFCQRPKGNPFNLKFDTEMLILCYDNPILNEWYAQHDNNIRVSNRATWSPETGFIPFSKMTLYARRSDMFGEPLRVITVDRSPYVSYNNGVLGGFLGEIVMELSIAMNFTIHSQEPAKLAGNWNKEKQIWTGAIGQVNAGRAQFGIAAFTVTSHRLQAVDFTKSLIFTRNRMYIKEPSNSAVEWSQYFKAFDFRTWAVILCLVAIAPILLALIKTRGYFSTGVVVESYMEVWGIYCQQGLSEFPKESSVRLAFFSIFISALIVWAAYSASLISYLTIATGTLPFNNLEGFADDHTYKLIVLKNTADYDFLVTAHDSFSPKLQALMKNEKELPSLISEGFYQVCSERVGFYIAEAFKNEYSVYLPCKVTDFDTGNVASLAFISTKGNPYIGLINYHLQRFQDYGVLQRLSAPERSRPILQESKQDSVTIWAVAPILAVFVGGVILGWLLLLIEHVVFCKLNNTNVAGNRRYSQRTLGISDTPKSPDASMSVNENIILQNCNNFCSQSDYQIIRFGYRP